MTESIQPPSILVVDDDEGLLFLMAEVLRAEGYDVATSPSGAAALAEISEHSPDLMLLDLKLKDVGGPELLERLRRVELAIPFIVVTGQGDEKIAVEMMKQGALDYVMKDSAMLELLPSVAKRALTAIERDRALGDAERARQRLEREILEVSEREQHRIGEDLHDGLGQQLTAIEMLCTSLKADVAAKQPALAKQVERIGSMLREAIAQTRSMSHGLVPVKDEPEALWASLVELADRTNAGGRLRCRFECPEPIAVANNAVAGHLYRIAQEAVNNAVKHSGATEIVIRFSRHGGMLALSVSDNGKGLRGGKSKGIGLEVMKHRAAIMGAQFSIESTPGRGVTTTCAVPAEP